MYDVNIGCLVSAPTFGLGRLKLWEKEDKVNISVKKKKRRSISINFVLYDVCLSYIDFCILFCFKTILTPFFQPYFWYLSH